jgi:pimeloyl-ACP methyl ester carboxylesterase
MASFSALLGRPAPEDVKGTPNAPAPTTAPTLLDVGRELGSGLQLLRLLRAAPWLARGPRGGGVVIDLPGWRAPEASNAPLRTYLRLLGYDARPWGLGVNLGRPLRDVDQLVDSLAREEGKPVALVGWSLGGLIAREVARRAPDRVSCVVTFGTPVLGGPTYTFAARFYGEAANRRAERLGARLDAESPITVPITAIYTRGDRIVDWRACIDRSSPDVRHVEVRSTHLGLGIDPDVWSAVASALARQPR